MAGEPVDSEETRPPLVSACPVHLVAKKRGQETPRQSAGSTITLPLPPELPVLPRPRERALLVLMHPDASIEELTTVVEGDPAMTAAVLRAANSAISSPVRPIHCEAEAVV